MHLSPCPILRAHTSHGKASRVEMVISWDRPLLGIIFNEFCRISIIFFLLLLDVGCLFCILDLTRRDGACLMYQFVDHRSFALRRLTRVKCEVFVGVTCTSTSPLARIEKPTSVNAMVDIPSLGEVRSTVNWIRGIHAFESSTYLHHQRGAAGNVEKVQGSICSITSSAMTALTGQSIAQPKVW